MNEKTELSDEEKADCGLLSELFPASEEQAEAMAHDALIYNLSVVLMRLDGNDGDPHQLLWTGGTIPEPWGDAWQRYEDQANEVLNAIGEGSALAMIERFVASPSSKSTKEADEILRDLVEEARDGFVNLDGDSRFIGIKATFKGALDAARWYLASSSIKEDGERAARLLTEQETQDAFADVPWPGESNPPHWMERMLAVQRKLLQVNGLSSPPSPLGDTPEQQEQKR